MAETLELHQAGSFSWFESPHLSRIPRLTHAFGSRRSVSGKEPSAGSSFSDTGQDSIEKHHELFRALGAEGWPVASLRQVHSDAIFHIAHSAKSQLTAHPAGSANQDWINFDHRTAGDALATAEPGILLSIRTADCVPILLLDPQRPAVAAVHAGWRGALVRIVEKTAGQLVARHGATPGEMIAILGPCIQACCYEVGEEVFDPFNLEFSQAEDFFTRAQEPGNAQPSSNPAKQDKWRLDLTRVVRRQLQDAGLAAQNITQSGYCTRCRGDLFFSYRGEPKRTGRMMTAIGIQPETGGET